MLNVLHGITDAHKEPLFLGVKMSKMNVSWYYMLISYYAPLFFVIENPAHIVGPILVSNNDLIHWYHWFSILSVCFHRTGRQ